jgi:hypothetical protein
MFGTIIRVIKRLLIPFSMAKNPAKSDDRAKQLQKAIEHTREQLDSLHDKRMHVIRELAEKIDKSQEEEARKNLKDL